MKTVSGRVARQLLLVVPAAALARMVLLMLLSHSRWASASETMLCTRHSDCDLGEFCGAANLTANASASVCVECRTICATPSEPSGCNLPCTAVDGDCCTSRFRSNCLASQVIYSGANVPCSLCDSAIVTVHARGVVLDATLKPTAQMLRDMAAGLPPKTERVPCDNFDGTLVGDATLSCAQTADGPPTLHGSASNCSRRTYAATEGFLYSQDPGWQNEASEPELNCRGISLVPGFNPLIAVGVDAVGRCQSADVWASWVRESFVGPAWVDGEHERWGSFCVDCDVETGYEGGTATVRFYRGTGCSPLSHSRLTHLTVDQCAFDDRRQVRYTGTCDVNSLSCPRPDSAVQVSTHRSLNPQRAATCTSEPELMHAFAAHNVGMDQCVQISRNNTATVVAYQSLRVCCTASVVRIRYYTDQGCNMPGHDAEYQRGCNSITDDASGALRHIKSVCSATIPSHDCPPVHDVPRPTIVTNADNSNEQSGTTSTAGVVIVIVAAVAAVAVAAGVTAAKFGGWDYRKTLFGESSTVAVANKGINQPKGKTEKEKIFEQYRAASFRDKSNQDAGKRTQNQDGLSTSDVSTKSMPLLPGSTPFDDDGTISALSIIQIWLKCVALYNQRSAADLCACLRRHRESCQDGYRSCR